MVQVLKLHEGVVLVPRSLALIFNLTVTAHKNNSLVNTMMVRALVDTLTIKFARESLQEIDGYDLFKLYKDFFLTENKRASMMREGIQSVDLTR